METGYQPRKRLELFPDTARIETDSSAQILSIADVSVESLALEYGTPLYVYDRATLDASVEDYRRALSVYYPGESGITYASKAFLCLAIAQWSRDHGLWLDCTGAGELHVAASAGVPIQNILAHGVNKNRVDLDAALERAGTLVVDNLAELDWLAGLVRQADRRVPEIWLRIRPGVAVETHAYRQTGQRDSKFGMAVHEVRQAVHMCLEHGLPLTGLHFHQGSHFHDPAPVGVALDAVLDLMADLQADLDWVPRMLCPGGGWGVAYHEDELPHPPVETYVSFVAGHLVQGCHKRGLGLPRLQLEPGRSLVARAGVAIYSVGALKRTPSRRWLFLDGGLADNPRPALYGARYSALPVRGLARPDAGPAWLAGPYCESSDILVQALPFPDVQPGEVVAVPMSGAYQLSMASNYNGARKPAVLMLQGGIARLIQRREELRDLIRRDLTL